MSGLQSQGNEAGGELTVGLPFWKRALDLVVITLLSPIWLTVGILVAIIVKLGSPGPIFFRQQRVGFRKREFTIYKFRTMQVNADNGQHKAHTRQLMTSQVPMTKLDTRKNSGLIPLGGVLRAVGIDELPQILNVIRGEMSLVGPRPCIPYEFELYEPWQQRRTDAVPGLTGLWQVSGKNRTTFIQMINFDLDYARNKSLAMDLGIILKTPPALWRQYLDTKALKRKESASRSAGIPKSVESY